MKNHRAKISLLLSALFFSVATTLPAAPAFDLGSHGKIIPATISNPQNLNLSAYAVLGDDKNLYLTIINKEHGATARDAKISINQNSAGFMRGQIIFLTAPNNDVTATSGETLGDAPIQNDGSWSGTWKPLGEPMVHNLAGGVFFVNIPAVSAAILKLSAN